MSKRSITIPFESIARDFTLNNDLLTEDLPGCKNLAGLMRAMRKYFQT